MIFIFGSRLYGKTDVVPGYFHVATKFAHLDYIPLIPTETYVILSENGNGWRGVKIPMSAKSIFLAWGRVLTLVTAIILAVVSAVELGGKHPGEAMMPLLFMALSLGLFGISKFYRPCTHASYERAYYLAQLIGMNEYGLEQIAKLYNAAHRPAFDRGFEVNQPGATGAQSVRPLPTLQQAAATMASAPPLPVQPAAIDTYFVAGRDRKSGQDVFVTVNANSDEDARAVGEQRGITVEAVEPANTQLGL